MEQEIWNAIFGSGESEIETPPPPEPKTTIYDFAQLLAENEPED